MTAAGAIKTVVREGFIKTLALAQPQLMGIADEVDLDGLVALDE